MAWVGSLEQVNVENIHTFVEENQVLWKKIKLSHMWADN